MTFSALPTHQVRHIARYSNAACLLFLFQSLCFASLTLAGDSGTSEDSTGGATEKAVMVHEPNIPLPPAGVPVMAGYATLHNHSSDPVTLVSVESELFGKVEMHLSTIENDVAKMRKQKELIIPANASLELKHGSYHLMLMKPLQDVAAGDSIEVKMTFASGNTLVAEFPVVKSTGKMHKHKNH